MDDYERHLGKFLSLILRHKPEVIGVTMDKEGWVDVIELLEKMNFRTPIDRSLLERIVAGDSKGRFAFSEDGTHIRAVNGHSIDVDVKPSIVTPPDTLYHGTSIRFLESIAKDGLTPQNRKYVHLSADMKTAEEVGARHGSPIVLIIDAKAMAMDGLKIYRAENGVYLTDSVPTEYLQVLDQKNLKNYGKKL